MTFQFGKDYMEIAAKCKIIRPYKSLKLASTTLSSEVIGIALQVKSLELSHMFYLDEAQTKHLFITLKKSTAILQIHEYVLFV